MEIIIHSTTQIWESSKRKELIDKLIKDGWKHIDKKRKRTTIINTFSKII
jgi:hypothetical protein